MNRQLRANGGIMDVTPRENFGLGSSLKKFVRKIIPNEVAEIATKAAPFVAPFNPLLAAGMSSIGTFDQTGSIGDSLKAGGMNYALGQGARYVGGGAQNLQTGFNPFSGYDASAGLTRGLLTNPVSDQGGLGKFFSNRGTQGVQGIDMATGGADGVGVIQDAATQTITGSPNQMTITDSIKQIVSPNSTIGDRGNAALDLLKKGSKAAFTKSDGKGGTMIDKAAVMGAIAFAGSYAEALALADDAGIELTNEEYDEAIKEEKKEEYAGYLENFFAGKKDGGRIGYEQGANELMSDIIMRGEMDIDDLGIRQQPSTVLVMIEGPSGVEIKEVLESDARRYNLNIVSDSGEFADKGSEIDFSSLGKKDGGRIGYEQGANEYITRRERPQPTSGLGLLGGIDPTIDESDQKIIVVMTENGPKMMTESEFNEQMGVNNGTGPIVIDMMNFGDEKKPRIINLGKDMKKDGGRINRRLGSPEKGEGDGLMEMLSVEVDAGGDEEEENMTMAGITFSSAEKSYLFRKLGGAGGSDRSFTMPQLYRVLSNPDRYSEDAAVLKEIAIMGLGKKDGGRIGLKYGTGSSRGSGSSNRVAQLMLTRSSLLANDPDEDVSYIDIELERDFGIQMKAEGGIMKAKVPTGQMRKNNAGVAERDYRQTGGFVPVGIKERADDVPAMLSKNEFVMTADAVRGIGNGDVEEGSKKLYNTMKQAEQVGKA